jgi:hypothetical protein
MDTFAKGLLVADKLLTDGALEDFVSNRYASFTEGIGKKIVENETSFEELTEYALRHDHIVLQSGRQEMLEDIVNRCVINPRRIFHLPEQADTYVDIDSDARWTFNAANTLTRCGWSPFEGYAMTGRIESVTLRGKVVFKNGEILAEPGYGRNIRPALV